MTRDEALPHIGKIAYWMEEDGGVVKIETRRIGEVRVGSSGCVVYEGAKWVMDDCGPLRATYAEAAADVLAFFEGKVKYWRGVIESERRVPA